MEEQAPNLFAEHPILGKLSLMDRISLSAMLAAESALIYAQGHINGMRYCAELVENITQNVSGISEETRRAFTAYGMTLVDSATRYVEEIKKGEASEFFNQP
jgi:hypothetical protein